MMIVDYLSTFNVEIKYFDVKETSQFSRQKGFPLMRKCPETLSIEGFLQTCIELTTPNILLVSFENGYYQSIGEHGWLRMHGGQSHLPGFPNLYMTRRPTFAKPRNNQDVGYLECEKSTVAMSEILRTQVCTVHFSEAVVVKLLDRPDYSIFPQVEGFPPGAPHERKYFTQRASSLIRHTLALSVVTQQCRSSTKKKHVE